MTDSTTFTIQPFKKYFLEINFYFLCSLCQKDERVYAGNFLSFGIFIQQTLQGFLLLLFFVLLVFFFFLEIL